MPQDTSTYDAVLKTVYEGTIRELLPLKVKTLDLFQEGDSKAWAGRHVEYPLHVGRNEGSGWYAERGALPTAGSEKYTDVRIPCRYMSGRITLSAQVIKASEGDRGAFKPAMQQEMDGIIKTMTNDRGRAMLHDGRGILALVNGDPGTGTTITVDSPGGVAGATNGCRFIRAGMQIGFVNPTTGALRAANLTVDTVAATGLTFTVTSAAAAAIADNDYIVRVNGTAATDVSDSSYQKESMGILGLVDDATYVSTLHNVNRTQYPIFQSTVISSVGAWSNDVVQRGLDLVEERGDGEPSVLIGHHSVRRAYLASMDEFRRYMGGDLMSPDGGTKAAKQRDVSFGGIRFMTDKYAPYGMLIGLDNSGCSRYALVNGEWADEDGAVLSRVGTGTSAQDAFEAFYRIWDNFHNDYPARSFRLDGITATVVAAHID